MPKHLHRTSILRAVTPRAIAVVRALAACLGLTAAAPTAGQDTAVMYAHYINVGQADCTLLEFPCGAMLIDAGSQDDAHAEDLLDYLDEFFDRRDDLDRTLKSIVITHPHVDHTSALQAIIEHTNDDDEAITVERFVDNGRRDNLRGGSKIRWLVEEVEEGRRSITLRAVSDDEVSAVPDLDGLTDGDIPSVPT